ncbi:MAG TPA: cardiolipin synthase [Usitatibacter sp.]|nr:cardiolipin synthase [Usitatibacter sp.]
MTSHVLQIAFVVYVVWVIGAIVTMLLARRSPTATLAWIFAFIALPFVSGLYYLVFGPRRMQRRSRKYDAARRALRRANEAADGPARPALRGDAAQVAAVARRLEQGPATFASGVMLLHDGDECIDALESAIAAAQHHIHMEYYIWEPDKTGTRIRDVLVESAKRGLEVRVIYDDVGSPDVKSRFWEPLRSAGAQVRAFNRVHLAFASINFANFRTHRKIAVIDGVTGFLGGINIHDPEMPSLNGKAAWRDLHTRIEGEPTHRLQRLFLETWNYTGGDFRLTPKNIEKYFPATRCAEGIAAQVIASGPDDTNAPMHAFFLAAIATARHRVLIETPYLIPDEPLESALRIAELRGVDVQVIVPRRGDSRIVSAASHTYCESFRKSGIKVYEYGPPMLHTKTLVIDETVGVIATANMDNRSFRLNFEVAAAFYDKSVIEQLAARFEEDRENSRVFQSRGRSRRLTILLESIARLSSPVL